VTISPLIGLALGFGIAGFLIYDGMSSVVHHKYCEVLNDDFSGGFNTNVWTKEAEVGGFGYAPLLSFRNINSNPLVQQWPIRTNYHHR
jgi:hypothetical protein